MNNQTKETGNTENEPSEKFINIVDSTGFDASLSPQIIQQLYEMADETTQTSNQQETNQNAIKENPPPDLNNLNDEQDVCYQIVADIFLFFKRRFSIPSILNTIHQCAGDIPTALQKLNHSVPRGEEPCNFSYHKITGTKEQLDAYFTF